MFNELSKLLLGWEQGAPQENAVPPQLPQVIAPPVQPQIATQVPAAPTAPVVAPAAAPVQQAPADNWGPTMRKLSVLLGMAPMGEDGATSFVRAMGAMPSYDALQSQQLNEEARKKTEDAQRQMQLESAKLELESKKATLPLDVEGKKLLLEKSRKELAKTQIELDSAPTEAKHKEALARRAEIEADLAVQFGAKKAQKELEKIDADIAQSGAATAASKLKLDEAKAEKTYGSPEHFTKWLSVMQKTFMRLENPANPAGPQVMDLGAAMDAYKQSNALLNSSVALKPGRTLNDFIAVAKQRMPKASNGEIQTAAQKAFERYQKTQVK